MQKPPINPKKRYRGTGQMTDPQFISFSEGVQYDGSKDDLDWRIDFRYLNFI